MQRLSQTVYRDLEPHACTVSTARKESESARGCRIRDLATFLFVTDEKQARVDTWRRRLHSHRTVCCTRKRALVHRARSDQDALSWRVTEASFCTISKTCITVSPCLIGRGEISESPRGD